MTKDNTCSTQIREIDAPSNAPTSYSTTDAVTAHYSDQLIPRRARQFGRWRY